MSIKFGDFPVASEMFRLCSPGSHQRRAFQALACSRSGLSENQPGVKQHVSERLMLDDR
jgi:hypothetical protein